ncbi:MAG TPA: hypothetical protein VKY92_10780 [Verrucomicrobiae bacterium]|nr:hypothetical protein [Verrucomicrobiae bacterium]
MREISKAYLRSAERVDKLMRACGHRPSVTQGVLARAFELAQPKIKRAALLAEVRTFFQVEACIVPEGLDGLPCCWLRALPELLLATRRPHWEKLPYMITLTVLDQGVLCLAFAQEEPTQEDRLTQWDALRIHLNDSLLPNRWQPLSRQMERQIWLRWPELRSELFQLPP